MFFALYAFACIRAIIVLGETNGVTVSLALVMSSCCLVCVYRVGRSFRLMLRGDAEATPARPATSDGTYN
jgi:hypothetical protein